MELIKTRRITKLPINSTFKSRNYISIYYSFSKQYNILKYSLETRQSQDDSFSNLILNYMTNLSEIYTFGIINVLFQNF
jgi:hypothetical protein